MNQITNSRVLRYLKEGDGQIIAMRSLLVFGKNVYSYKFPFCDALLRVTSSRKTFIKEEEIFEPFVDAILRHMKTHPKQYQGKKSSPSNFMVMLEGFNSGKVSRSDLMVEASKVIPNNVFDAFQNIGGGTLDNRFLFYTRDKNRKGFEIRDNLLSLVESEEKKQTIIDENEARWRVVEEAWKIGVNPSLIEFDPVTREFKKGDREDRPNLRSAVDSLMPYQKGLCFYCNRQLNRFGEHTSESFPDVDHVLPLFRLKEEMIQKTISNNPNGIWNLVISCMACNRGDKGKFAQIPDGIYFKKLSERNEYLAIEHPHSFKFAILNSLGITKIDQIEPRMVQIYNQFQFEQKWKPNN